MLVKNNLFKLRQVAFIFKLCIAQDDRKNIAE